MSDSTTFSQKVLPHSRKMFAVAYHFMQRSEEAEDVVQDVMVKLWQMREKLPPDDQLLPFLLTVTKNLCIDRLRSQKFNVSLDSNINPNLDDNETPRLLPFEEETIEDEQLENKDRLRQTLLLMKQLPPDQERVLKLKVFQELENEQIARMLNIKEDYVRQLLSRARHKLKELAEKQGVI